MLVVRGVNNYTHNILQMDCSCLDEAIWLFDLFKFMASGNENAVLIIDDEKDEVIKSFNLKEEKENENDYKRD